jgi:hypothetical protein
MRWLCLIKLTVQHFSVSRRWCTGISSIPGYDNPCLLCPVRWPYAAMFYKIDFLDLADCRKSM